MAEKNLNSSMKNYSFGDISGTTHSSFIAGVQAGDEDAWRCFYQKYAEMIRSVGAARHLSSDECKELQSEVMLIFWRKFDTFIYDRSRGRFRDYVAKIADNTAMRLFRRIHRKVQSEPAAPVFEYPEGIDAQYMDEWRDFLLHKALDELEREVDTEKYQIFCMTVIQNRPIRDIARITGKTPNGIYVIRSRCLKKLQQLIRQYRAREEGSAIHSQRNS